MLSRRNWSVVRHLSCLSAAGAHPSSLAESRTLAHHSVRPLIPERLRQDAGWRGALHVLETAFAERGAVWRHIDVEARGIDFDAMLAEGTWSGGEHLLLQAAASLFSPRHQVPLWEIARRLNSHNLELVIEALRRVHEP